MSQPAPTTTELLAVPAIQYELEAAWYESLPGDPARRHEEGGWVYFNPLSDEYLVRRASAGGQSCLDLSDPPEFSGFYLVATFHTHPNPASEGWGTGPSTQDTDSAHLLGVPCMIRAEDDTHTTGPASRRGGLAGNPGFPL